jgi:hypothetical protein
VSAAGGNVVKDPYLPQSRGATAGFRNRSQHCRMN